MTVTQATKKKLFAASSNECAFPECDEEVVDIEEEVVIGVIAHIRARSEDGPRHDPDMTDDERDEFSNLMVLCPTHHTRIDKNPEKYPPEKLEEWKEQHEQEATEEQDVPDDILSELEVESIEVNIEEGSYIRTENQMGGQVAHDITNIGPQPRNITDSSHRAIVNQLQQFDPLSANVTGIMGDSEAIQLSQQISDVLEDAGWDVTRGKSMFDGSPQGVKIRVPEEKDEITVLIKLLRQVGLKAQGVIEEDREGIEVVVGANL